MKKVLFNTWSGAFFNPGGGEVQLLETEKALQNYGYRVERFDQWTPQKSVDIFHQFSIARGVEHVIEGYKNAETKIAISTILWDAFPKNSEIFHHIRALFSMSDILFTNSNAESVKLSHAYDIPIEKFHKTRNSISREFLSLGSGDLFRETFKIKEEFVLSVANIDKRKNTKILVKACEELNLRLILIGAIRDLNYFNEIKLSHQNFTYLGALTNQKLLKSAYCAAKVFALPSLCETPGIAALEAAAQGVPIVITSEGATQEYFDHNVSFVNPFDLDEVKRGLIKQYSNNNNTSQRSRIISTYTWEKAAQDVINGYKKINS